MIQTLTKKQRLIFDFVAEFIGRNGFGPSFEEIGRGVGLCSLATVHKHVEVLCAKGWLSRSPRVSRSIAIMPEAAAAAGLPGTATQCPRCKHVFEPGAQERSA